MTFEAHIYRQQELESFLPQEKGIACSTCVEMEAGDRDILTVEGRTHLPACDGERGAHWNHKVSFAAVEGGRSHRNANHQTWGGGGEQCGGARRGCCEKNFSHESLWNK